MHLISVNGLPRIDVDGAGNGAHRVGGKGAERMRWVETESPCNGGEEEPRSLPGWEQSTMATAANPWGVHGCQWQPGRGCESTGGNSCCSSSTHHYVQGRAAGSAGKAVWRQHARLCCPRCRIFLLQPYSFLQQPGHTVNQPTSCQISTGLHVRPRPP